MAHETVSFAFSDEHPPYSSVAEGSPSGIFPEIIRLVFDFMPAYGLKPKSLPWARAQYDVEHGRLAGFMTYPSTERQQYALFSSQPLFVQDFGTLVYAMDSPKADIIAAAEGFDDLSGLTVIVERGAKWEEDNIPSHLDRVFGQSVDTMMHFLMLRKTGDYFVMPRADARFLAQKHGYGARLGMRDVTFISNAMIPFHIGISRQVADAEALIQAIDAVVGNPQFQAALAELIDGYH